MTGPESGRRVSRVSACRVAARLEVTFVAGVYAKQIHKTDDSDVVWMMGE
jgi:hypothetical protein